MPCHRVASSALQTDTFVVSGMQGLKKMVVRGAFKDGEVRDITILYDQAMEGTMDPLVGRMSSAFVPFAAAGYAVAGAADTARRKVEYGSGVVVSSAATSSPTATCSTAATSSPFRGWATPSASPPMC